MLGAMGYEAGVINEKWHCFYFAQSSVFAFSKSINGEPASHGMALLFLSQLRPPR